MADPSLRVILITGANRGLGFATAQALGTDPQLLIIVGARSLAKASDAISSLRQSSNSKGTFAALELDITSSDSIGQAFQTVESTYGRVDTLINNAGVSHQPSSFADSIAANCNINAAAPARVTDAFLPLLIKSSAPKLIFISTILASLAAKSDPGHEFYGLPYQGYRASKAALNMVMVCYHSELKDRNVKVFAVCPGFLATDFAGPADQMRSFGAIEPEEGAKIVVDVVEGKRDADAGRVVAAGGVVHDW